jgi:hypothetical protein
MGSAPAKIRITKIYFDSPGDDTGSNTSLNAEYVVIKNTGTTRKALTGWTLRDAQARGGQEREGARLLHRRGLVQDLLRGEQWPRTSTAS